MKTGIARIVAPVGSAVVGSAAVMLLSTALVGCTHSNNAAAAKSAQQGEQTVAAKMVEQGASNTQNFLNHTQTEGVRNMLGGVRGVFIAPSVVGGAAVVGYETGTGFLMCRHGKDWSDPVFFTLSGASAGWQVGGKEARVLILLMTDTAVDGFVSGHMKIGGTGGFAIGTWGLSGAGAGGLSGGLEAIILSTNQGAFLGGGWTGVQPKPAKALNDDTYGPDADLRAILDTPGGKIAAAREVRAKLTQMVVESWTTSGKHSPPTTAPSGATAAAGS